MGAKQSSEMKRAKVMVLGGMCPARAAKATGLTRQAIYHSKWYKEWKNVKNK